MKKNHTEPGKRHYAKLWADLLNNRPSASYWDLRLMPITSKRIKEN